MKDIQSITATHAVRHFASVLDTVADGRPVCVTRWGRRPVLMAAGTDEANAMERIRAADEESAGEAEPSSYLAVLARMERVKRGAYMWPMTGETNTCEICRGRKHHRLYPVYGNICSTCRDRGAAVTGIPADE